jgi:hypothetical protein
MGGQSGTEISRSSTSLEKQPKKNPLPSALPIASILLPDLPCNSPTRPSACTSTRHLAPSSPPPTVRAATRRFISALQPEELLVLDADETRRGGWRRAGQGSWEAWARLLILPSSPHVWKIRWWLSHPAGRRCGGYEDRVAHL